MSVVRTDGEPATHVGPLRRPALLGEAVVLVSLLFVYDRVRTLTPIGRGDALRHGVDVLRAEGPIAVEQAVNRWLAGHAFVDMLAVGYYQFLHLGATLAVLAWCYVRRPDVYRPARTALVVTNVAGLAAFAAFPVAPPRLLPEGGFIDLVARAGFGTSHGPIPMDAYAAMPSLHIAWALCVAMAGLAVSRSRVTKAMFVLHPILTAVVVVATGNHYVGDVVVGAALGLVATVLATRRAARRHAQAARPVIGDDRFTLVSFHAHPDDETLFTGGTLARAAAEGHRVVVVCATLGDAGLTGAELDRPGLAARRLEELEQAVTALGGHRVAWLGYTDSGRFGDEADGDAFTRATTDEAAARLAEILQEEDADVVTTYDRAGGYGHPDHIRVHEIGARAAQLAETPVVLEATVDRRQLLRVSRLLRPVPGLPAEFRPAQLRSSFAPTHQLTHRVDVSAHLDRKRAAMRSHATQHSGGTGVRSLALYLRLPKPVFRKVFGAEWFIERGRRQEETLLDDVFASVRRHRRVGSEHHEQARRQVSADRMAMTSRVAETSVASARTAEVDV